MTTDTKLYDYAVALTGGIATGKSTVAAMMQEFGLELIDADTIAHNVLQEQSDEIADLFGAEMIKEGTVDRKALGRIVFGDEVQRRKLESLLHPLIELEIADRAAELERAEQPYLIDIPLFFEREAYPIDKTIVVYAPRQMQIARLMERNGFTRQEAQQRIDAQIDIEAKRDRATYLIDNQGDIKKLKKECDRVYREIMDDFA